MALPLPENLTDKTAEHAGDTYVIAYQTVFARKNENINREINLSFLLSGPLGPK